MKRSLPLSYLLKQLLPFGTALCVIALLLITPRKASAQSKCDQEVYAEIERFQEGYNTPRGKEFASRPISVEDLRAQFDLINQRYQIAQGKPFMTAREISKAVSSVDDYRAPTKYQDYASSFLIGNALRSVQRSARSLKLFKGQVLPKYGTLYTNKLNAESQRVELTCGRNDGSYEYFILVNKYVLDFSITTAKLASRSIQIDDAGDGQLAVSYDTDAMLASLAGDTTASLHYMRLVLEFDGAIEPESHMQTENQNPLVVVLTSALDFFVVAHEFAHVMLKHNLDSVRDTLPDDGNQLTNIQRQALMIEQWKHELEADQYAQHLLLAYCAEQKNPYLRYLPLVAGLVAITSLDCLSNSLELINDRAVSSISDSSAEDLAAILTCMVDSCYLKGELAVLSSDHWYEMSHPPPILRQAMLMEVVKGQIDQITAKKDMDEAQSVFLRLGLSMPMLINQIAQNGDALFRKHQTE